MLPRVVATDLDGTLLRSDGTLSERTRRAIIAIEEAGALVVVCTARPARWLIDLADAAGRHGVAVCANGAVLFDVHRRTVLESSPLPAADARELVTRLRGRFPDGAWAVERVDHFAHEPSYVPRWPVADDTLVDHIDVLLDQPAVKVMLRDPTLPVGELAASARATAGELAEITYSSAEDTLLEMSARGVSKASTLAEVCAARDISASEVVAFGDMPNDLAMVRWAGRGVAVANAHPELRAAADAITASNDEDGVALVLEQFLSDR